MAIRGADAAKKIDFDYAAYGCKDGRCIYDGVRNAEVNRRQLVLKAARDLHGHPGNTAEYLKGLEEGMKMAGATEATARRLRYEVAAVIASYGVTIEVEVPKRLTGTSGKRAVANEQFDAKALEAQGSWLALVNTARAMRSAAVNRERQQEGLPRQIGRGNHTIRKYHDTKFDKLREQLIERTATNQALDLLDAAIIAVANAYSAIASENIEELREVEKKIHDKVSARTSGGAAVQYLAKHRLQLRA